MSVAGIGAGGVVSYRIPTVNIDDIVNSYKSRRASIVYQMKSSVTKPRRNSYTGFAMHCDTAISFDHTANNNSIPTLSERVQNSELSAKSTQKSK